MDCTAQLISRFVSRTHCRIFWNPSNNAWMIQDAGSMNGTYINDKVLAYKETRELKIGDYIGFGIDL